MHAVAINNANDMNYCNRGDAQKHLEETQRVKATNGAVFHSENCVLEGIIDRKTVGKMVFLSHLHKLRENFYTVLIKFFETYADVAALANRDFALRII